MGKAAFHPENMRVNFLDVPLEEVELFLRHLREATVTAEENLEGHIWFARVIHAVRAEDGRIVTLWFFFEADSSESVYVESRLEGNSIVTRWGNRF
ncbi:MAG: hypothetical protein BWY95_01122 [Bacteroidetes bacterium ADurb.BinA104]|jgi:hypothetical protein|nr:MAG: hypothetical protein BWY95_01122 [Bacteroidetes bacterium ADurb.BinA104]